MSPRAVLLGRAPGSLRVNERDFWSEQSGGASELFLGRRSDFHFGFLAAEKLIGLFARRGRPLSRCLQLFEVVQLLDADDGPALRETITAHEGASLALPNHQLSVFALVALDAGWLGGFCPMCGGWIPDEGGHVPSEAEALEYLMRKQASGCAVWFAVILFGAVMVLT